MQLEEIFPQLSEIENQDVRKKTERVLEEAVAQSSWSDIRDIPYIMSWTLRVSEGTNLVEHTKLVTDIAIFMARRMTATGLFRINMDELVSAAILHDIGLVHEFERDPKGGIRKRYGRTLIRHPIWSGFLAVKHGLSPTIAHIISAHSREGDYTERTVEATILYHADWTPYECLQAQEKGAMPSGHSPSRTTSP